MSKSIRASGPAAHIADSVRDFVSEAESLLRMTAEFSSDSVEAAKKEFDKKLRRVKHTLEELEEGAVERYHTAVTETDRYVRRRPWQVAGVALAAGIAIGYFGRAATDRNA